MYNNYYHNSFHLKYLRKKSCCARPDQKQTLLRLVRPQANHLIKSCQIKLSELRLEFLAGSISLNSSPYAQGFFILLWTIIASEITYLVTKFLRFVPWGSCSWRFGLLSPRKAGRRDHLCPLFQRHRSCRWAQRSGRLHRSPLSGPLHRAMFSDRHPPVRRIFLLGQLCSHQPSALSWSRPRTRWFGHTCRHPSSCAVSCWRPLALLPQPPTTLVPWTPPLLRLLPRLLMRLLEQAFCPLFGLVICYLLLEMLVDRPGRVICDDEANEPQLAAQEEQPKQSQLQWLMYISLIFITINTI